MIRRPARSRLLGWAARAALLLASAEVASCAAIAAVSPRLPEPIRPVRAIFAEQSAKIRRLLGEPGARWPTRLDPELGWRYAPGFRGPVDQLNAAGLRSAREYDARAPAGVLRVAAFGDSFVYGTEVLGDESWPALIEGDGDPRRLEVLNYGVPGYGTDQAYLRYLREGAGLAPDVVVMGFPPTRLAAFVGVRLRRRYLGADRPESGGLFNPRSTAFAIQRRLFEMFAGVAAARGARALVLMLPDERTVRARRRGEEAPYDGMIRAVRAGGIDLADAAEAFREVGGNADVGAWFAKGGHYSPAGNRVVAAWVARELRRRVSAALPG